jgi:beta-lactamase class A
MNRRSFNLLAALGLMPYGSPARAGDFQGLAARCQALEAGLGGRLGVMCIDTGSGAVAAHRADERFPMCSTFKWLAAALVLSRVDAGRERLDRRLRFGREALIAWSPVTQQHADGAGMTLAELCDAAVTQSDNTAGNLLLDAVGGPAAWTGYARAIGDTESRLDAREPKLNADRPGDPRNTTTPAAMAADLRRVLLGDALQPASRQQLVQWMLATQTGAQRLRAGLPDGWRLAHKTGTGSDGTEGDVGVFWPSAGAPIVVAAYVAHAKAPRERQDQAFAEIARGLHGWKAA